MLTNLREVVKYRALLWALVVRHLAVRYRGSVLGFFWSLLNPLCLMLVYLVVFRFYIRFGEMDSYTYTVFLFCGLLPWLWFSSALNEGTAAIVSSGHLITKSMFPAHLLPTVAVLTTMVNFLLSLPILICLMVVFRIPMHATMFLLPLVVVGQALLLYGVCLGLGALNVRLRDVQHLVANLLTFLFFLCPILYPARVVPERFRFTMDYNPLAWLTRFYQELIMEGQVPEIGGVLLFFGAVLTALLVGTAVYDRYRESFAELL